jgi:hypothetical protein
MSDMFANMIVTLMIVSAVVGWATIEGLIWIVRNISISFS